MLKYTFIYMTLCPMAAALACLVFPGKTLRSTLVSVTGTGLIIASVMMSLAGPIATVPLFLTGPAFASVLQLAEFCLLGLFLFFGIKTKAWTITGLSLAQLVLLGYFELILLDTHALAGLYCDGLSQTMVLLITVVGSLTALYALHFMPHRKHHHLARSRQSRFFALIFLIIGSLNGLVMVNDLMMVYLCFGIFTLCSFLLIGLDSTARCDAIAALRINILGGGALLAGIVMLYSRLHTLDIQAALAAAAYGKDAPLMLLCLAGCSQAAQIPVQRWLSGTTPSPVPALLNATTMLTACAYMVLRFAPTLEGTAFSSALVIGGVFAFLTASVLAMGHRNGKSREKLSRVVNYTTGVLILMMIGLTL